MESSLELCLISYLGAFQYLKDVPYKSRNSQYTDKIDWSTSDHQNEGPIPGNETFYTVMCMVMPTPQASFIDICYLGLHHGLCNYIPHDMM